MAIDGIDIAVFLMVLGVTFGIGIWASRRENKSPMDYFLAGHRLPWYAIGTSYVASNLSSDQMIGMVGQAYNHGIVLANWQWRVFPIYTFMIWIFLPFYLRNRVSTMPEFLERRFNPACRDFFALITAGGYIAINLSSVLYGGGLVMHDMLGFSLVSCIWVIAIVAGIYTAYGGLSAVVWTDLPQSIILFGGGFLLFFLGLGYVDGGWTGLMDRYPEKFHLIQPADHPLIPWPALLITLPTLSLYYSCTNQFIVQRCLGARSEWDARIGVILAGFLNIAGVVAIVLPGIVAFDLFPDLAHFDLAFSTLLKSVAPIGLKGLIVAGLMGAILSTIDSLVNSTSTVLTFDIYKRWIHTSASETQMVRFGRVSTVVILAGAAYWAPNVQDFGSLFEYFQRFVTYISTPFAAVFLIGVMWRRINSAGAIAALVIGIPTSFILEQYVLPPGFNFFNLSGITWVICVAVMTGVSLMTEPPDEEKTRGLIWSLSYATRSETNEVIPIYKSVVFWWLMLGGVSAVLYAFFW